MLSRSSQIHRHADPICSAIRQGRGVIPHLYDLRRLNPSQVGSNASAVQTVKHPRVCDVAHRGCENPKPQMIIRGVIRVVHPHIPGIIVPTADKNHRVDAVDQTSAHSRPGSNGPQKEDLPGVGKARSRDQRLSACRLIQCDQSIVGD